MTCGLVLFTTVVLLSSSLTCLQAGAPKRSFRTSSRRSAISEVGTAGYMFKTVPCNPEVMGSVAACYNQSIEAAGVEDYPFNSTPVAYPTDGSPWGVHLQGPYPDGKSYLLSWYTGVPQVGNISAPPDLTHLTSRADVMQVGGRDNRKFFGKVISYLRSFTKDSGIQKYNYLSAHINHVVLSNLLPGARYKYSISDLNGKMVATKYQFKTLQVDRRKVYPLRIGVMGDVGQTYNSSQTRDHMRSNRPDVVFHLGDNSYADDYNASSTEYLPDEYYGTNQLRWDSYHQLWQPLYAQVPTLNCIGNHEQETSGIAADYNYTTTHFEWPTMFPFQTYAARWPVPGTRSDFGNIDKSLYYSTVVGGVVKLVVLNNYAPFQPGSPQHTWAMKEFKAFDRKATPWLFVMVHGPPYHTYYEHYKELDCFMSFWEDVFYKYGVDLVLNGHVHAYERSHPVYKYKPNTCAPIYVTIGDGGNIEGPYRYFVDEVNILTNKTYCASMAVLVKETQLRDPSAWAGPSVADYQLQAQPPVCRSMTWQPANGAAAAWRRLGACLRGCLPSLHRDTWGWWLVGQSAYLHKTVPCNPEVMGSVEACYDQNIDAQGVVDYPFNSTAVAYPTDGRPWGVHLVGPYPDGKSYLLSWYTGGPQVGNISAPPDLTHLTSRVEVMQVGGNDHRKFSGKVISYLRSFTEESGFQDLNYLSAHINHVVLSNLLPGARYKYSLSDLNGKMVATKYHFKTLQMDRRKVYPLRIGVMGDVGQTYNSSQTRDHMRSNRPDVVFHVGDNSYADDYTALSTDYRADRTFGTNQLRWDSYHQLWQPLYAQVPILNCIGNHELEMSAISAGINYTTNHIEWPTNFPFQAYAARWPVPGTRSQFGNIDKNLYYSTVVGGVVNLIVLNNYAPFQPGSPQHMWAMKEFKAFDRAAMPWLFVIFHGPPYHTYYEHYKELDCFMSIWEDVFYDYGVDLVFGGHVHAYERSHPVYKYKPNTCAPIYVTIGDGGNIEGPYRYFVDEVNILTNKTYCAGMASLVKTFQLRYPSAWAGPGFAAYQLQAQPLVCRSMTWQPANGVGGGPVIIPYSDTSNLGFCQSSQPVWSAFRDPSFGHAIVELVSDTVVKFNWFQNYHGQMVKKDSVTLQRVLACPNKS